MFGDDKYEIHSFFEVDTNEQDVNKWNDLTHGVKILDIKKLDFYEADLPQSTKNTLDKIMEEPTE